MSDITREELLTLMNLPEPEDFAARQKAIEAQQAGKTRQEIVEELAETSESMFDPETAVPAAHRWVNRGLFKSCEGAGHPSHRSFVMGRSRPTERKYVSRWLKD